MSLGGIIAGALKGGADAYGEVAKNEGAKQMRMDLAREMSEIELQKALRLDEVTRQRVRADDEYKMSDEYLGKRTRAQLTEATGALDNRAALAPRTGEVLVAEGTAKGKADLALIPVQSATDVARGNAAAQVRQDVAPANAKAAFTEGRYAADTRVSLAPDVARAATAEYDATKPLEDRRAVDTTTRKVTGAKTEAAAEREITIASAGDPKFLAAQRKLADAKESSAVKASAAATMFELSSKRALTELRTQLARTTDPTQRQALQTQIGDLSGASTKSYSDMVGAAQNFRLLAQNLRKDASEGAYSEAETADMLRRAREYEDTAAGVLGTTVNKRLPGAGGNNPGAVRPAPPPVTPPSSAIGALKADPRRAGEFDAKYGKDASKRYLTQ